MRIASWQRLLNMMGITTGLVDGTPHCNVRRGYVDTKHGIAPIQIVQVDN
jgi:hypothetical protein